MSDREGARKTADAIVVSSTPDVCLTPAGSAMVPVPYPIMARFDAVEAMASTVLFTGDEAFTAASRITTVRGDEAGSGGGVLSGVNRGYCRPVTYSNTVFAEGQQVVFHDAIMEMNCMGADGPGNTLGRVVYVKSQMCVSLDESGEFVGDTDPPISLETREEQGALGALQPRGEGSILASFAAPVAPGLALLSAEAVAAPLVSTPVGVGAGLSAVGSVVEGIGAALSAVAAPALALVGGAIVLLWPTPLADDAAIARDETMDPSWAPSEAAVAEEEVAATHDTVVVTGKKQDVPCFKRNPKHDKKEFDRQLKAQEEALNKMSPEDYLKNRKNFPSTPRDLGAQRDARERYAVQRKKVLRSEGVAGSDADAIVAQELAGLAATHVLDMIAGGDPSAISGLGDAGVNSSIGRQWKDRVDELDKIADDAAKRGDEKLDVKLRNCED